MPISENDPRPDDYDNHVRGPRGYWVDFDDLTLLGECIKNGLVTTKNEAMKVIDLVDIKRMDKVLSGRYELVKALVNTLPELALEDDVCDETERAA